MCCVRRVYGIYHQYRNTYKLNDNVSDRRSQKKGKKLDNVVKKLDDLFGRI